MAQVSPDGRFEIHEHERSSDSYMYSDTSYAYAVASVETGDELMRFSGSDCQDAGGSLRDGVNTVRFDGGDVVATSYDGTVQRLPLPVSVEIVDGGEAIELRFPDGTQERRPRNGVIFIGSRGIVIGVTEPAMTPRAPKPR